MRQSLARIEARVTEELEQMERREQFGVPLGITIYEARFQYEDAGTTVRSITIREAPGGHSAPAAGTGGTEDAPPAPVAQVISLQPGAAASSAAARPGAMQFAGTELDKLLDQFKNRSPDQVAALLKLMELQTRQNIVSELAQSGGVIVFSAKELGLSGNSVVEDTVTNQLGAKLPPAKAAE